MDVRVLLEPSPEFAISEVLWLRAFGPALDALLTPTCLANRLEVTGSPAQIHTAGRRIYKYWVPAYRSFRQTALTEARKLLKQEGGRCILAALDLASYYDHIDPSFLIEDSFVAEVRQAALAQKILFIPQDYLNATRGLLDAFARFRALVGKTIGVVPEIGIPIGALTARLISNLALCNLDKSIAERPDIAHYGRYVDDILIVQLPGKATAKTQAEQISSLLPLASANPSGTHHTLSDNVVRRSGSLFQIQAAKLRIFELRGTQGLEYLGAVENELEHVSSERRRFLDPRSEQLQHVVSASPGTEPIRALREADALSIRKFAVGAICEKVVTAAAMLSREESRKFSRSHLGRVGRLSTDWSRWVDLLDQSTRIFAAALIAGDAETANEVLESLLIRINSLRGPRERSLNLRWSGRKLTAARAKKNLQTWIRNLLIETMCSAAPFSKLDFNYNGVGALENGLDFGKESISRGSLLLWAQLLSSSDLRAVDRETDHYVGSALEQRPEDATRPLESEIAAFPSGSERVMRLREFINVCKTASDPVYRGLSEIELLLLARPPRYVDIVMRWLRAEQPLFDLIHVINAVRGTRYFAPVMQETDNGRVVAIANMSPFSPPRRSQLVLGNLCTDEQWGKNSLSVPTLSIERQRRLSRVLNQAIDAAGRAKQRGVSTLLVLPELALPRQWQREVFHHIGKSEPSLSVVTGIEYDVVDGLVFNEAVAFLPRPFMSAAGWIWTKRRPAHHEAIDLKKAGFSFSTRSRERRFTVLDCEHGRFLPLICSELLEVDTRSELLGRIDLLLVPAWNQDTASFEHLVHSSALELHCFVGVANNGIFSDCRARGPYAEPWRREASRLISRGENETVVAELPIDLLRLYRKDPVDYDRRIENDERLPAWKPMPPGMEWIDNKDVPHPSKKEAHEEPLKPALPLITGQ
nr:reverse transcriptase domain-containing protein [Myxococcus sp. CA039A]